jgi:hypothetical protein
VVWGIRKNLETLQRNKDDNNRKIQELDQMERNRCNVEIKSLQGAAQKGWGEYSIAIYDFGKRRRVGAKQINGASRVRHRTAVQDYRQYSAAVAEINQSAASEDSSYHAFSVPSAKLLPKEPAELK